MGACVNLCTDNIKEDENLVSPIGTKICCVCLDLDFVSICVYGFVYAHGLHRVCVSVHSVCGLCV